MICPACNESVEEILDTDECEECHDAADYALDECGCERCYDNAVIRAEALEDR